MRPAALATLLAATVGHAADVVEVGSFKVEASGFYKPYVSALVLQPGLVDGVNRLQTAIDEARTLLPPDLAAQLPPSVALPAVLGLSTQTARVQARATWGDRLELEAAWQLSGIISSSAAFAGNGGALFGAAPVTAQRRLVDFAPFLVDAGGFKLQHNLDRLALSWRGDHLTIVAGRQVISWGTGRLWNPTDLMSPFAPTDVDREVRRGVDAVRVSIGLGATSQLDVIYLPQRLPRDMGGVLRARTNLDGWDFSFTAAKYVSDVVLGADFSGDIGQLGVRGEASWTLPLVGLDGSRPVAVQGDFGRGVLGVDWKPVEKLMLTFEYAFNGFGAERPEDVLKVLKSDRVVRGEIFGASRHAAGLVAAWSATELLTVSATGLLNLVDGSGLVVPSLEYWFEQRVLLRAGGYVPFGRPPSSAVTTGLSGPDVLTNSARWVEATSTLGARSEYGLSSAGAFIQVSVSVN